MYYILDENKKPKRVLLLEWAQWMGNNISKRRVAYTQINSKTRVSTVFRGIDHSFNDISHEPILFETLVFTSDPRLPDFDNLCARFSDWQSALEGHHKLVEKMQTILREEPTQED